MRGPNRDGPTTLYRLYDAEDRLLYVGITSRPQIRLEQHANARGWWGKVARTSMRTYPDRSMAADAERQALASEEPAYNVKGVPGRFDPSRSPLNVPLSTIAEQSAPGSPEQATASDETLPEYLRRRILAMLAIERRAIAEREPIDG